MFAVVLLCWVVVWRRCTLQEEEEKRTVGWCCGGNEVVFWGVTVIS